MTLDGTSKASRIHYLQRKHTCGGGCLVAVVETVGVGINPMASVPRLSAWRCGPQESGLSAEMAWEDASAITARAYPRLRQRSYRRLRLLPKAQRQRQDQVHSPHPCPGTEPTPTPRDRVGDAIPVAATPPILWRFLNPVSAIAITAAAPTTAAPTPPPWQATTRILSRCERHPEVSDLRTGG